MVMVAVVVMEKVVEVEASRFEPSTPIGGLMPFVQNWIMLSPSMRVARRGSKDFLLLLHYYGTDLKDPRNVLNQRKWQNGKGNVIQKRDCFRGLCKKCWSSLLEHS